MSRPKNIMIVVSSSDEYREEAISAMMDKGHNIIVVANGKNDALKKLESTDDSTIDILLTEGYLPFLSDAEELATEVSKKNKEVLVGGLCAYSPAALIKDVNYQEDKPHRLSDGHADENGRYPEKSFDFFIHPPQELGGAGGNLDTLAEIISDLEFSLQNEARLKRLEAKAEVREEARIKRERGT
jgi:hypothetical protein